MIKLEKKYTNKELPFKIKDDSESSDGDIRYKLIPCLCIYEDKYLFLWFDYNSHEPTWLDRDMGDTFGYAEEIEEYYILPDIH